MNYTDHPLTLALATAVPLEIERLREADEELRTQLIAERTGEAIADLIAAHGDDLLFGGRHCASTFAAVARALACLAWQPGGVTFAGLHCCARHDLCLAADAELEATVR